jgi:exodeoxyribonuclease V beta subunit
MSAPQVFSLLDELPTGCVAIEASAGTGKTFTLAGLVVRYVAEEAVRVEELLMVTFTRAAAAELRDRVRSRLSEAAAALRDPAGIAPADQLLTHLAAGDRDVRLSRLEQAVIDFDAATITTIHGFAQQVLATLGSAAPGDREATLLDDTDELVEAVSADVLATESVSDPHVADELPDLKTLSQLCAKVLGNPGINIIPGPDPSRSTPGAARVRRLVDSVVEEVHRRRRVAGTLSFDDLLTRLRDALDEGSVAVATLRRRFRVALIDEFQDTDPVQWAIFSRLFASPGHASPLILVADPKQAIYAFRGANVHTYLEAAYQPDTRRFTLDVNRRSDGALIDALGRMFEGATFGDPRIEFVPVNAAREHEDVRVKTEDGAALPALSLRLAVGADLARGTNGWILAGPAQAAIARDLALEVHRLLETAWIPSGEGTALRRRVRPGNIAVLLGTNGEAELIQTALRLRGIPAVVTRSDSVLQSDAARHWRFLLAGLTRPADPTRARTAAFSCFFGWSVADLDAADDAELGRVQDQLFRWSEILNAQGTVAFCARVWSDSGVTARVLATSDGDRELTDLDHIAGLLQMNTVGRRPTAAGLLATLKQLESEAGGDPETDLTARQVDSDAEAVRIMTVHAAKGLEFPIVCVPTLWRRGGAMSPEIVFRDPATGLRTFDVANGEHWPTPGEASQRKALAEDELRGENLRLLYVALTRAQHKTLVWWSRVQRCEASGLSHVLFARHNAAIDREQFEAAKVCFPDDAQAASVLAPVFAPAGDAVAITVTGAVDGPARSWDGDGTRAPTGVMSHAVLQRVLPRDIHRWSFSAISDRARHAEFDPEDESLGDSGAADEPAEAHGAVAAVGTASRPELPLGAIAGGTQFGTLVHEVLALVDFAAADLDKELRTCVEERLRWTPWPVDPETLVAGLRAAIESPLGPLFGTRRLRDLGSRDRLDELSFELRLGGKGRFATDRDIGALMLAHLADDDPLRSWAQRLGAGLFGVGLAGHLTGSIDMVVRLGDAAGSPRRFVVVDYKTNVLCDEGREPRLLDYHPGRLAAAMAAHHYPLQALLYLVALHRYLRWRLPGYRPAEHLGGAAYLFVRGMAGAGTPLIGEDPHGVFTWRVPPALVTGLSDLLDGAGALA